MRHVSANSYRYFLSDLSDIAKPSMTARRPMMELGRRGGFWFTATLDLEATALSSWAAQALCSFHRNWREFSICPFRDLRTAARCSEIQDFCSPSFASRRARAVEVGFAPRRGWLLRLLRDSPRRDGLLRDVPPEAGSLEMHPAEGGS